MNLDLSDKTALVCGASRGLGFGIAKALAELQCTVILLARNEVKLKANVQLLKDINSKPHSYLAIDMSNLEELEKKVFSLSTLSPFQILINNTGGPAPGLLQESSHKLLSKAFRVHIQAAQLITRIAIPHMVEASYGRIINIISTSVRQPISGLGVSNTIRGAMASWAKTLSIELASQGITVNNILPGTTKTERIEELIQGMQERDGIDDAEARQRLLAEIPFNRFGEIHEIAEAAAFLASPVASYITGVSLPVDGGKIKSI